MGLESRKFFAQVGELSLQVFQTLQRSRIGFFFQGEAFYLQLADAAIHHINLLRHGIYLYAQPAGGFVYEVYGFVGQEAVGEVAIREHGCRYQSGVLDAHAVMHLVAFLQTSQDADGVFGCRLLHHHRLEATLQGGVFFYVLAVFVQGGGADHAQFATGEHGFQHVAGVQRTFCRSCAYDRVELVYEGDDSTVGVLDFLQHGLQPLLELASVFGAGYEGCHIQRQELFASQAFGDVAVGYALRQAFHYGCFAHARLADEHGVVLSAAGEHLDGAADFLVSPDHGIELVLGGQAGEITGVAAESVKSCLWGGGSHTAAAANLADGC